MNGNLAIERTTKNKYNVGLDIIRIIAMFLVISVHATSFYGFVEEGIQLPVSIFVGAGRYLSYTCVPLFLLLTGYLNAFKKPSLKYYSKIIKILTEFFLCALVVAVFSTFYVKESSFQQMLLKTLSFSFPNYSWYIKMYVGLFLLGPFVNYIICTVSKKQAILLVIVSILVFSQPFISEYWQVAYPLMYYFIGGVLRKYPIKIKRIYMLLVVVIMCFLQTVIFKYPYLPRYNVENYNNFGCVMISVSLFLLFYDINCSLDKTAGRCLTKTTRIIANASMSTFLISEIFETLNTTFFNRLALTNFPQKLPYLLYLTPLKFIISVLCGIVISTLSMLVFKLGADIIGRVKNKRNNASQE